MLSPPNESQDNDAKSEQKVDDDGYKLCKVVKSSKVNKHQKHDGYKRCGLQMFFNLKQLTPNIYDVRSTDEYKQSHVAGASNLPKPMKVDVLEILCYPVLIYGDKKTATHEVMEHLWKVIQSQRKDVSLYVFDGDYASDVYKTFPYLCADQLIRYPNMILDDGLFLGDGFMAENKDIMINLGITHIVNVTKMDFMLPDDVKKNIKYLKLPIDDTTMEADKMASHFESAVKFIDDALVNENDNKSNQVYVHCMAGVSRSASVVIAYLMKSRKYTLCDAYIHTKKCRQRVGPNQGFRRRLIEYEKQLFGGKSTEEQLSDALKSKAYSL